MTFEATEELWKPTIGFGSSGQQVEIGLKHARHENGAIPGVADVHEVDDETNLAEQASFVCCAREGERGNISDNGASHLKRNRP